MNKGMAWFVLGLGALLSACSGNGDSNGLNSLQITLVAPSGVNPRVVVLGPNNYRQTVTASTTLTSLAPGNYYLLPQSVRKSGSAIIDTAYSADPQTVVVSGSAQAKLTYVQAPGSGKVWVGMNFINSGTPLILGYDGGGLGMSNPALRATTRLGQDASVDDPQDLAFDAGGNLWVVSRRQNQLIQYTVSQLDSNDPDLKPARVLTSADFDGPFGLAFDEEGGLWVSNFTSGKVVHFSAYALASASTTLTPDRTLQKIFYNPAGLAFDSSGNLWVADGSTSANKVYGFRPSKIASSGSPAPDFTLTGGTDTTPIAPYALAFDAGGNLWVSTLDWLFRYPKSELSSTAAKPDVQLQTDTPSYLFGAMAFDNEGNLWVTDFNGSQNLLLMYAPSSQTSGLGQQVKPDRSFSGPDLNHPPYGLAFNMAPANLPLR
ncbi:MULTISPECIES: hypothetical protein [unclassified Meiothermus]|uniref:hypothetical protein n=1 Tax=unclassified Meiothermus TaxID=370471 RepID=UPI000D7C9505|nr:MULTISPECIES: hypothetical protein [unclassified Meiothermus]PZA07746.1 hypothetical protein DNA98_05415 [Meiothermus sp. Pnk-1]RYM38954.1 hypothetical protein EWH23_04280 [Meiothermus sp. PNK-Is4]